LNFFGHVAVASWMGASSAMALGAMLPDLAAMAGAKLARVEGDVRRGIELHHRTDAAFHALEAFAVLCGETTRALRARGVERGPARAAAHVGVELCLDGTLLDDERAASLYLRALADRRAATSVVWQGEETSVLGLLDRLAGRGLPAGYRDPVILTRAVSRALSRRPRLALDEHAAHQLEAEMPALRARVERGAPELLEALRASLRLARLGS
jgi:acyl carrier protein phosphodiesterase